MTHISQTDQASELIPKAALRALGGLVVAVLGIVCIAVWSGRAPSAQPTDAPISAQIRIFLSADMSGSVRVLDTNGSVIADLAPEQGGFISGVGRVLDRERGKRGVDLNGPVDVIWRENGRLSVSDPSTGWSADLMGFGADNARAFAKLVATGTKGALNGNINALD